jgi:hypothetical protein
MPHHAGRRRRPPDGPCWGRACCSLPLRPRRRGQAGHRAPASLGRPLRPRLGVGSHEARVRAGRHRLPPARPPDGRGHRGPCAGPGPAPTPETPTTGRSRRRPAVPLWIGGASPPRAAGRRGRRRLGAPVPHPRRVRAGARRAAARDGREAGRDPEAVEAGVVVFACVGDDDEAPERGRQWLSELYGLPPKAFDRHLVAGSPETCAAALDRYVEAGARHILVMVAGSPAVEHFGQLRSAFVAGTADACCPGVGVRPPHETHRRRHPRHRHDRHEPARPLARDHGLPGRRTRPWPTPGRPDELGLVIMGNAMAAG